MEQVWFVGLGQRLDIGEPLQKSMIVRDHSGDPRLLQHYFGNPDGVWVAGFPPRQFSMRRVVPRQQVTTEFGRGKGDGSGCWGWQPYNDSEWKISSRSAVRGSITSRIFPWTFRTTS